MPVACSQSQLTGQNGLIMFKPAGTSFCLLDYTDFGPVGDTQIALPPNQNDFRVADPVVFTLDGAANLDGTFTAGTTYFVVARGPGFISVAASVGGTALQMAGNGGGVGTGIASVAPAAGNLGAGYANGVYTGVQLVQNANNTARGTVTVALGIPTVTTVTTPGSGYVTGTNTIRLVGGSNANGDSITAVTPTQVFGGTPTLSTRSDTPGAHISIEYAKYAAVCQVESFSINMTRQKIETTSIPCVIGGAASKYAPFRTYQPGFLDGTGSMAVKFTSDNQSIANRVLANSILRSNDGAWVKLYLNAVGDEATNRPDDANSLYIEAPISLEGFDTALSSNADTATTATVNFSISGLPRHLFLDDLDSA
jgi:hypothetical protein